MEPSIVLAAVVIGYLLGSISFARIVSARVKPGEDVTSVSVVVGDGHDFTFRSVSATAVRVKVGRRWGILTGVLDMLKVALPVLAFSLLYPGEPYALIVAGAGLVGHDWPIWHRFRGGRGESVIYGALFVLDPLGAVVTTVAGILIGVLAGNILAVRWAGMILVVPWFLVVRDDPAAALWMVFSLALYFLSLRPELVQYIAMRRTGNPPTNETISRDLGMGAGLGRTVDRISIPGLIRRLRARGVAGSEG